MNHRLIVHALATICLLGSHYIDLQGRSSRHSSIPAETQIKQTICKIKTLLIENKRTANERLKASYPLSEKQLALINNEIIKAKARAAQALLSPKANLYRNPTIPKDLIEKIEQVAKERNIHPKSFDIDIDPNNFNAYAAAKFETNTTLTTKTVGHSYKEEIFEITVKNPIFLLSPRLLEDYQAKTYYIENISDYILHHEITHIISQDGLEQMALQSYLNLKKRMLNPKETKFIETALEYASKLAELNADLFGALESKETAESIHTYFNAIELSHIDPDNEHFCSEISYQWIELIWRAYHGESFEKLLPAIETLKKEQLLRCH